MRLTDVYNAKILERNVFYYCMLESKEYGISYRDQHHVIAGMDGGPDVLNVEVSSNVLVVRVLGCNQAKNVGDVMVSVLAQNEVEMVQDVQQGSLMHFHRSP